MKTKVETKSKEHRSDSKRKAMASANDDELKRVCCFQTKTLSELCHGFARFYTSASASAGM